jgi:hypothetical protein
MPAAEASFYALRVVAITGTSCRTMFEMSLACVRGLSSEMQRLQLALKTYGTEVVGTEEPRSEEP